MNKTERRCAGILEALNEEGRLQVAELAARCGVSLVTIRKDLTLLEERGLIRREQGCALLNEKTSMARRLTANYTAKCRLAEKAASLVEDGETVLIESGSCCILLAETLGRSRKNVTIVTNSVFMADYVGKRGYARIILLGGDYQPDSEAVVGPLTKMGAQTFHVRSFFCGTDGYRSGAGFTGDDHLRAETLRGMAASADRVVILAEGAKFSRPGVVSLFAPEEVSALVTDDSLDTRLRAEMEEQQIEVL